MPVTAELDELFVAAVNAGAKKIMLPEDSRNDYEKLKTDLKNELTIFRMSIGKLLFGFLPFGHRCRNREDQDECQQYGQQLFHNTRIPFVHS